MFLVKKVCLTLLSRINQLYDNQRQREEYTCYSTLICLKPLDSDTTPHIISIDLSSIAIKSTSHKVATTDHSPPSHTSRGPPLSPAQGPSLFLPTAVSIKFSLTLETLRSMCRRCPSPVAGPAGKPCLPNPTAFTASPTLSRFFEILTGLIPVTFLSSLASARSLS